MQFLGIAVVMNDKCNAHCAHCFGDYGPRKSRLLPSEAIRSLIDQAKDIRAVGREFAVAGGEVFLYWDRLLDVVGYAAANGFAPSITTNGSWATSPRRTERLISALKSSGLVKLEISVDQFHQAFVPIVRIKTLLRAAKESGIPTIMLRCHSTKSLRLDAALTGLDVTDLAGTVIVCAPVVAMGRASTQLPPESFYADMDAPSGACAEGLILTVNVAGDVFPCCAGSELCPPLNLGNLLVSPLSEILRATDDNFLLRALVNAGPSAFLPVIQEMGVGQRLPGRYTNICDLCHRLFSDAQLTAVVSQFAARRRREIADRLGLEAEHATGV